MIIALNGKAGSGKDTVAKIIQYLIYNDKKIKSKDSHYYYPSDAFIEEYKENPSINFNNESGWTTKKFAGKLKQIAGLILNIPIEDFEKEEVKNTYLPECWDKYGYADGFTRDDDGRPIMTVKFCDKERYLEEVRVNWQTAYHYRITVRQFLTDLGTNAMRDHVHTNIHVNGLFSDYKQSFINNPWYNNKGIHDVSEEDEVLHPEMFPNWLITDLRFENEAQAVKEHKGICIRVNRSLANTYPDLWNAFTQITHSDQITDNNFSKWCEEYMPEVARKMSHISETDLDKYVGTGYFRFEIDNNGTLEELIEQVRLMLIGLKLI